METHADCCIGWHSVGEGMTAAVAEVATEQGQREIGAGSTITAATAANCLVVVT